jgi:hypothetical protein
VIRLVCGNCGRIREFETWDSAYQEGWDTVAEFGYNACNECPGVSVYLPMYYAQLARKAKGEKRERLLAIAARLTMEFPPASVWPDPGALARDVAGDFPRIYPVPKRER